MEEEDAQNDSWFLQVETAPLPLLNGRDHDPCRSSSSIALASLIKYNSRSDTTVALPECNLRLEIQFGSCIINFE